MLWPTIQRRVIRDHELDPVMRHAVMKRLYDTIEKTHNSFLCRDMMTSLGAEIVAENNRPYWSPARQKAATMPGCIGGLTLGEAHIVIQKIADKIDDGSLAVRATAIDVLNQIIQSPLSPLSRQQTFQYLEKIACNMRTDNEKTAAASSRCLTEAVLNEELGLSSGMRNDYAAELMLSLLDKKEVLRRNGRTALNDLIENKDVFIGGLNTALESFGNFPGHQDAMTKKFVHNMMTLKESSKKYYDRIHYKNALTELQYDPDKKLFYN